jgi:hypothetical protein
VRGGERTARAAGPTNRIWERPASSRGTDTQQRAGDGNDFFCLVRLAGKERQAKAINKADRETPLSVCARTCIFFFDECTSRPDHREQPH